MSRTSLGTSLKSIESRRKEVFKPILGNPYTHGLEWPVVDHETGEKVMEYLTQLLGRYGTYVEMKRGNRGKNVPEPAEARMITVGFNSTVRRLEAQAAPNREKILGKRRGGGCGRIRGYNSNACDIGPFPSCTEALKDNLKDALKDGLNALRALFVGYVFVTKSEVTLLLADSFPQLAVAASLASNRVKLVELPRGALARLLQTVHMENTGFVSLCSDWSDAAPLFSLIQRRVPDVRVPWLEQLWEPNASYSALRIEFLRTTAPVAKPAKTKKKAKSNEKRKSGDAAEHEKPKRQKAA